MAADCLPLSVLRIQMNMIRNLLPQRLFILIASVFLLFFSAIHYKSIIGQFPSHVHAWSQADRLALAYGFVDNGFDFFRPATNNLRPEYEATKAITEEKGITQVDFPLVEYVVAALMVATGYENPLVFRLFVLFVSLLGIVLFGLALRSFNLPDPLVFLMMFFVFSAPVYTYYQAGMIPGIPAFALSIGGLLSMGHFRDTIRTRYIYLSMACFTLAALIRLPFVMLLLSSLAAVFLINYRYKAVRLHSILAGVVSLMLLASYYVYNQYLGRTYGSVFLQHLMPADDFADFSQTIRSAWNNWKWHYFTAGHYLIMLVALILLLVKGFWRRLQTDILLLTGMISLIPGLLYVIVMAKQFVAHDYYLIDSIMFPLILITASGMSAIPQSWRSRPVALWIFVILMVSFMLYRSAAVQKERYTTHSWDRIETTRINFTGSEQLLDRAGIASDARILVLDAYTNNTALLLMKRKGYTVINTTRENIAKALGYHFDYIAIQNSFLSSDVLAPYPELRTRLKPVVNNGRIGVYQYSTEPHELGFAGLFGFDAEQTLWQSKLGAADTILQESREFIPLAGFTIDEETTGSGALLFESKLGHSQEPDSSELLLVIDIHRDGKLWFYQSVSLKPFLNKDCNSCPAEVYQNIPAPLQEGDVFKCYLWNRGKQTIEIENIDIRIINLNVP